MTAFCFIAGYPIAYYLIFHLRGAWLRRFVYILLVTPLFTSNIVRAFGWIVILGRRGIVNSSLQSVGLIERPLDLLYSQFSIVVGLVVHPPAGHGAVRLQRAPERRSLAIEAARDLGARPSLRFAAITFPLSLPGVVAGSIIVFALSVSAYVIPSILSGGREMVMSDADLPAVHGDVPARDRRDALDRAACRDTAPDRRLHAAVRSARPRRVVMPQ